MKQRARENFPEISVAVDIGTANITALIGEHDDDGSLRMIGSGKQPSHGVIHGVVGNIEAVTSAIGRAIEEAELMSGWNVHGVHLGISGQHISSLNCEAVAAIRNKDVTAADIAQVVESARARAITEGQRILHAIPQSFAVDDMRSIQEPLGLSGVRLEADVHVVRAPENTLNNAQKCVSRCGLETDSVVVGAVASSQAVLTEEERGLGVCMLDIGAGTIDLAIYVNGALRFTDVIGIGGESVTSDIARGLRTPTTVAETLKLKYGCAQPHLIRMEEQVMVPGIGSRPGTHICRQSLATIIEARYDEIYGMAGEAIARSGLSAHLTAGVVLTGGTARIEGGIELAEAVLGMPVRLGDAQQVCGLDSICMDPGMSTAFGLLTMSRTETSHLDISSPGSSTLVKKAKGWMARLKSHF